MTDHTKASFEHRDGVWWGTCSCGADWTDPTEEGVIDLLFSHREPIESAPSDCAHDWRHRGYRLNGHGNDVTDLYYCTRCLEHTEKQR